MRLPKSWFVPLALLLAALGSPVCAQESKPADSPAKPASAPASEEEVQQLRREVAELKAQIQRLIQVSGQGVSGDAHLVQTKEVVAASIKAPDVNPPASSADIDALQNEIEVLQKKAAEVPPITAGWNGEHFFLRSPDSQFTLMPVGYLNAQYTFYKGDGAPPDTFAIRRARFGVQGSYGKQLDYAFLFDSAATNGISIRDAFIDFKPWSFFKIEGGQFKVPFSQEVSTGDTNVEFIERSITSVLYPDASGTFRAPGIMAHGDFAGGALQYWVAMVNGQGLLTSSTTNEPEVTGRVRVYPFKNSSNAFLKGLAFGGSAEHSRSRGLSNEVSFNGALNDAAYTFFPQFRINGGIERYNGHFQWLDGPWGIRGEYTQILEKRVGVGSEQVGGIGFLSLPGVVGRGAYGQISYMLTGEREQENAIPRVKHPVIGPASPGESGGPGFGAWQLKFRYSWIEGKAPGFACGPPECPITPVIFPAYGEHTSQITGGFNWYLNYWVLLKFDVNVDRLVNPSVQGISSGNYYVILQGVQFRF